MFKLHLGRVAWRLGWSINTRDRKRCMKGIIRRKKGHEDMSQALMGTEKGASNHKIEAVYFTLDYLVVCKRVPRAK